MARPFFLQPRGASNFRQTAAMQTGSQIAACISVLCPCPEQGAPQTTLPLAAEHRRIPVQMTKYTNGTYEVRYCREKDQDEYSQIGGNLNTAVQSTRLVIGYVGAFLGLRFPIISCYCIPQSFLALPSSPHPVPSLRPALLSRDVSIACPRPQLIHTWLYPCCVGPPTPGC